MRKASEFMDNDDLLSSLYFQHAVQPQQHSRASTLENHGSMDQVVRVDPRDSMLISVIDRKMSQYFGNLLHSMDGINARVSLLETRLRMVENSVDVLKGCTDVNYGKIDGKLREVENFLREMETRLRMLEIPVDDLKGCSDVNYGKIDGRLREVENILREAQLSQMETRLRMVENSIDDLKSCTDVKYGKIDGKLREVENILREKENGIMRVISLHWYGGNGGELWDDGILYDGVREIYVKYCAAIDAVGFAYASGDQVTKPQMHGGNGGGDIEKITLEYPREHLISVSGRCADVPWLDPVVVRSIKFETNLRSYGPFGEEVGRHFNLSTAPGEKIIGFHGRSSNFLDAIGLHITPH